MNTNNKDPRSIDTSEGRKAIRIKIAKHIFGWKVEKRGDSFVSLKPNGDHTGLLDGFFNEEDAEHCLSQACPNYPSQIAAAMEVVDALNASSIQLIQIEGGRACYITIPIEGKSERFYAEAPTRELAICLAALRAKGIEI